MTFFLFFVYAPVSISELGSNYDEDLKSENRIKSLEKEVKELKEMLKQNNLKLSPSENQTQMPSAYRQIWLDPF